MKENAGVPTDYVSLYFLYFEPLLWKNLRKSSHMGDFGISCLKDSPSIKSKDGHLKIEFPYKIFILGLISK
ncbi:hypothetical protein LEP1GSC039_1762 [Leptospira santarosai str. 2000027870]|nr:hypothetical protein LEP1GSC039_1762 [Leptospira santarosai str. 2000027870]